MRAILEWIIRKIIMRCITFMHEWGIFEVLGYILCFELIYEGSKLDIEEHLGFGVAFSGLAFVIPMWTYSKSLHTRSLRRKKSFNLVLNLVLLWIITFTIPAAIVFQSTFLGYICFSILFSLLGFRMDYFGMGFGRM